MIILVPWPGAESIFNRAPNFFALVRMLDSPSPFRDRLG